MTLKDRVIARLLRLGLLLIRGLVFLKPKVLTLLDWLLLPFRVLWAILLSLFIPVYKILYGLKKQAGDVYRPAKNRVMYAVANRHTVHVAIGLVLLVSFGISWRASAVRAEAFGEKSIMYNLIASDTDRFTEEDVALESLADQPPTSYWGAEPINSITYGLVPEGGMFGELIASSSGLEAPHLVQGEDSVAPRDGIITYAVQDGDTLSGIASKFGISLNTLLWANNLNSRSSIRTGKELTILPTSGVLYTVAKGDTATKIASKFGGKVEEILAYNNITDNSGLTSGKQIIIPGGKITAAVSAPSSVGRVFASAPKTSAGGGSGAGSASGSGNMVWPTDLRVITQYFGWKHTGIDIDCKFTNDNYAAEEGTVIWSGWKGGYGYTVEVQHASGIITRYGHHAKLYVSKGDSVTRGQPLGLCGTTGRSTGTHLHFEVIIGGKYQNPLEYIR